ncbi:MAG: AraC family transcriptional regulator [Bacteroidota bacterium]
MTYYTEELKRIKAMCFSNEEQVEMAVNTKRYLDIHFASEINLTQLAQLRYTSKYHLIRVFKRYYGLTPRQYLIDKRIEKARAMLKAGESVSDTCFLVGYDSVQSFSHLFKAKSGMSPSAYRRATFDKSK